MQERNRVGCVRRLGYRYPLLTPKTPPILRITFIEAEQRGGADPLWDLKFYGLLLNRGIKCYLNGESLPYFGFPSRRCFTS